MGKHDRDEQAAAAASSAGEGTKRHQADPSVSAGATATAEDEVDPLDAFMEGVYREHAEQVAKVSGPARGTTGGGVSAGTGVTAVTTQKARSSADDEISTEEEQEEDDWLTREKKKAKQRELAAADHRNIQYAPFRKNFYTEAPDIAAMTEEEVVALRKELEDIKIRGKHCPKPIREWVHAGLRDKILAVLRKRGFDRPTPIQCQAIPAIMSGRDVIGCAKTGSGKTLAFLLPLLRHVLDQPRVGEGEGPIGLVLAPTRELAVQIYTEARKFAKALDLRVVCVYGGAPLKDQIADLKRGAEIVVCTPGRMIEMLTANAGRVTNLRRVTFVVMDEADRMFDMGFEPQITRIVENTRPDRQTVLFSATFPRQVEALAKKVLKTPVEIIVGGRSVVANTVDQHVEVWEESQKFARLLELLGQWYEKGKVLIFVERQEMADMLFRDLLRHGYPSLTLHAGKDQYDRESTIADFKNGVATILIATSVASRGLDVRDLVLVVNYTAPNHMEDYVHRVGRTGRAGRAGTAYTFLTPDEDKFAPDIAAALEASGAAVPAELAAMVEAVRKKKDKGEIQFLGGSGYGGKGFQYTEDEDQKRKEARKRERHAFGQEMGLDESSSSSDEDEAAAAADEDEDFLASVAAASAYAAALAQQQAGLAAAVPPPEPVQTGAMDEIEINDYPQHARWVVTQKDSITQVQDQFGVALTAKGQYTPPGKNPPPGERKLYLLIEGHTVVDVKRAKAEIKRMLEEAAAHSQPEQPLIGRYRVL